MHARRVFYYQVAKLLVDASQWLRANQTHTQAHKYIVLNSKKHTQAHTYITNSYLVAELLVDASHNAKRSE